MNHSLAIISPVYQNYDILQDFFSHLEKQTNKKFYVFLVDLSIDKKLIINKNLNVSVIKTNNLGYAHGVNVGLKKAIENGFKKFCIINNDTYMAKDFVNQVIKSIDQNPLSIIGGKIYYAKGFEYHKNRYQKNDLGKIIWYAGGSVDWQHALTPHRGVDEIDAGKYNRFEETDFINGCLICFDKEVVEKVGFWDEDYFLYFEDADYCVRATNKSVKLFYDPSIVIWHKNAQSTGGSGSALHLKYQEKNRLTFGLKYAPWRTKFHLLKNYLLGRFNNLCR